MRVLLATQCQPVLSAALAPKSFQTLMMHCHMLQIDSAFEIIVHISFGMHSMKIIASLASLCTVLAACTAKQ